MSSSGKIHSISISQTKGVKKQNVIKAILIKNFGIENDAHAGTERQVSLLPFESFEKVKNDLPDIKPGDFAENITTLGLNFEKVNLGKIIFIGNEIELEITQIGKECRQSCHIKEAIGDCIMPREGIFAKVIRGGAIRIGDEIRWSQL